MTHDEPSSVIAIESIKIIWLKKALKNQTGNYRDRHHGEAHLQIIIITEFDRKRITTPKPFKLAGRFHREREREREMPIVVLEVITKHD